MGTEDKEIANKDAGRVVFTVTVMHGDRGITESPEGWSGGGVDILRGVARLLCHHVRDSDGDQTANDEQHSRPLEPGQVPPEKYFGENT